MLYIRLFIYFHFVGIMVTLLLLALLLMVTGATIYYALSNSGYMVTRYFRRSADQQPFIDNRTNHNFETTSHHDLDYTKFSASSSNRANNNNNNNSNSNSNNNKKTVSIELATRRTNLTSN